MATVILPTLAREPTSDEVEAVLRQTWRLTACISLISAAVAGALAVLDPRAAVLPAAFVLGWLNLAGL